MKRLLTVAMALALTAAMAQTAMAQPDRHDEHRDDHRDEHQAAGPLQARHDWRKGGGIAPEDWKRGNRSIIAATIRAVRRAAMSGARRIITTSWPPPPRA